MNSVKSTIGPMLLGLLAACNITNTGNPNAIDSDCRVSRALTTAPDSRNCARPFS